MDVNVVMDGIGTALGTIAGLRVFDYVPDTASPPFAFVELPETVIYDNTKQRGTDAAVFSVFVAVGKVTARTARDDLGQYLAGTGTKSIKAAVDSPGLRRVATADISILTMAGVDYLAARFDVEVAA